MSNDTAHLAKRGYTPKNEVGTKAPAFDGSQPCAQSDPDIFFPDDFDDQASKTKQAKLVCNSCTFIADCLDYALKTEMVGIWGGTTTYERKEMRKRRNIKTESLAKFMDSVVK